MFVGKGKAGRAMADMDCYVSMCNISRRVVPVFFFCREVDIQGFFFFGGSSLS